MTTVLNKGAWPRQVACVMSMAMADLGIENFEYDPQVMAEGADLGKGCRVMQLAGPAPRWCVGVEIPDRVVFDPAGADVARDRIRKQMDDFVRRVLVVPGWRPYPSWTSCSKCSAPTRWFPTYTPNGGYGCSFQTYFIWDQGIEQKDLASPLVDTTATQKLDATASKDALIRDLMTFVRSNPDTRIASEYLRWGNKVESFRDRAEKLGVKL